MRQRMDVADVEERTKIRAKYLRALENEEWGLLPGPTFVRTFIRTYAEAVGLDPHRLVEEYRAAHDTGEEPEAQPQPLAASKPRRGGRPERRRPRAPGPPGPLALAAAVLVAVIALLLVLGLTGGNDDKNGGDKAARTQTAPTAARTTRAKPKKPPRPAPRRGVTIRIAPMEPTYLCLDTGQGTPPVFEGILEQARTFKNARELRANLGKRAVKITANGKPLPVQNNGNPLGVRVTKAGPQEITNGPRPCG